MDLDGQSPLTRDRATRLVENLVLQPIAFKVDPGSARLRPYGRFGQSAAQVQGLGSDHAIDIIP
jgi:hypothetical protein